MNKTYVYALVALVLVAAVVTGGSALFNDTNPSDTAASPSAAAAISTVTEGTQNTAAVAQAIKVGQSQPITWDKANYPSTTVKVAVIRKVSDTPISYEPVRVLAAAAPNTGSIVWTPSANELGQDIFIEVGCVDSTEACRATISPSPLTVTQ